MTDTQTEQALLEQVDRLYAKAKSGKWEEVWGGLAGERELAAACSRYVKPSSGWTFLHQAAYAGNEASIRGLVRLGASLAARSKENETTRDIALKRGHVALAALLAEAERGADGLWAPSADPQILPGSGAWGTRAERRAWRELWVGYASGHIVIPPGARYFVDAFERVLVGWHGTYDPPSGMDGEPLI